MAHASLTALLTDLIDYAGLFPPAQLPMNAAVENYLRYRDGADAWMLGRFVCPAARLGELLQALPGPPAAPEVPVAAVLRGGAERAAYLDTLGEDLASAIAAERDSDERILVGVLESRMPAEVIAARDALAVAEFLEEALARIREATYGMPAMFFEAPATGEWDGSLEPVIEGLLEAQMRELEEHSEDPASLGFKLRCGGASPADTPSLEALARALEACVRNDVPVKFTAGLHHPVRRAGPGPGEGVHGFLNVFTATLLCSARGLTAEQLLPALAETDPAAFHFSGDEFEYGGYALSPKEIADHRELAGTFGSCSFDEPREDLRALGLLDPAAEDA